ncbi:MAG TPA: hypothetical protein VNA28_07105 [Solirubrobacteraceae bacterium]|nr:hypothetical protein [Solirubrobacteraceae bacterium]
MLSRGNDWILNHAKDAIRESEAMRCPRIGPAVGIVAATRPALVSARHVALA